MGQQPENACLVPKAQTLKYPGSRSGEPNSCTQRTGVTLEWLRSCASSVCSKRADWGNGNGGYPVTRASPEVIWHSPFPIEYVNSRGKECCNGHLGIEILEAGPDYLKGRMPVDRRTRQPAGALHGGVSVVLAETLASWAAAYVVDPGEHHCVGQEINANHIRAVHEGWVYGVSRPLHIGRRSHVWDVRITDELDRLVCISRVTMSVLAVPNRY